MAIESSGPDLIQAVALLGAGVAAGAAFKRFGFGSVLGYLLAGIAVGPFGLRVVTDATSILHVAELGVIMFLFVIGLEMRPSRLWGLRREIFGLGATQVLGCAALLTGVGVALGLPTVVAFIAASGFVLSSTAIIMQVLDERGETATPLGQRAVAILLLEDLAIVPLLAIVAILAPRGSTSGSEMAVSIAIGASAIAGIVIAGRFLLNPMFRLLASARAREVMTAAALMVVLGAALVMQLAGLSMAMGAFLAGVMLSESAYRHQLEADVEPFRGVLLGLFFIAVGMSLDLAVVLRDWQTIAIAVGAFMVAKAAGIYVIALLFRSRQAEAIYRAALFAQGGEFAFVLYSAALAVGIVDGRTNAALTATVILSMLLTPFAAMAARRFVPDEAPDLDGVEEPDGVTGSVLMIGFGRFGQIAAQSLLARGVDVTIIDSDAERIRNAADFGFKVYYGDGRRIDVLRASGAATVRAIAICIDDRTSASRIVELARATFPQAQLLVRAYDRGHAIDLIGQEVDYQIRETFESAMVFGQRALVAVGLTEEEAAETAEDIRRRDQARLDLEITSGLYAGMDLLHGRGPTPTPLVVPTRDCQPLSEESADVSGAPKR